MKACIAVDADWIGCVFPTLTPGRVPQHGGIGQQAEAACLVHDLLVVADAELAPVGEEQPARERVPGFAAVEQERNRAPHRLVGDVAQDEDRLARAAQDGQRLRDRSAGEALSDTAGLIAC